MLCDWMIGLEKTRAPKGNKKCKYYAPGSQNVTLRTFFAHMKKEHEWEWQLGDFKNWPGCLDKMLKVVYNQRLNEYVSTYIQYQFIYILIIFL